MNLKANKIKDAKPSRNWKSTLTGGALEAKPSEVNLVEFGRLIEGQAKNLLTEGQADVKGNACLAVKISLPKSIKLRSSLEPIELIGAVEKNNEFIGYYRPKSGWKESNQATKLK